MPRAQFAGVTFDMLLDGLSDRSEGRVTVRETGSVVYIDLGGGSPPVRRAALKFDSYANFATLYNLPGTSSAVGTLTTAEGSRTALLLSIDRYFRKGAGAQLARSEWLFLS